MSQLLGINKYLHKKTNKKIKYSNNKILNKEFGLNKKKI